MKRFFALALCLILLTGCTGEAPPAQTTDQTDPPPAVFMVGYGRADITPTESMPLSGYFSPENRWSKNVLDPLYATCIAFTCGEDTMLVYQLDISHCSSPRLPMDCKAVCDAVGLDFQHLMLTATHTHSAPLINLDHPVIDRYNDYLGQQLLAAARQALDDRKPATVQSATATLENMNFVRHYYMSDGTVAGDNFGSPGATALSHVEDADNVMQLLRITREGGKDIVLVNWQTHPHRTGGTTKTNISSDIVGSMRMALEETLDCHMAYFTGASGNINPTSRLRGENTAGDYIQQGQAMAAAAAAACENMTPLHCDEVKVLHQKVEVYKNSNPFQMPIAALSLGDAAFVFAPYEMFNSNGIYIKEHSPYQTTFVATLSGPNHNRYVADSKAYEYKGEEPYEVGSGSYVKGSGEILAEAYVQLLRQLHGE